MAQREPASCSSSLLLRVFVVHREGPTEPGEMLISEVLIEASVALFQAFPRESRKATGNEHFIRGAIANWEVLSALGNNEPA